MPFKRQLFRITLLIIGLWSIAGTALAQDPDKYIFRYHLVYPSLQRGDLGIKYYFDDGTSVPDRWAQLRWGFDFVVDREIRTAKRIAYIEVYAEYDSNEDTDDCSRTFGATWYVSAGVWGNAYGSQVTDLIMPQIDGRGSRGCSALPNENTTKVEMSIIPVIHIQNPDPERADPLKNIYCDNQPVHLKVDYHGGDAQNDTYWQYRLDPADNFHPLSAIGEIDNWDNPGTYVHGPDVYFTLQQVFGANYAQYLNKRIEFRAVHAQKYEYGYWDGDNIQRHVDKPNEGSNTFTYIFYPSTVQPVNVKGIDPPCSDGKTYGVDIQFNRPLVPGEVISPITIKTQVGDQTVDQYPRTAFDPPITLDASNTFHFSGTLNPGDYYLNIEGYYLDPLNRQCNENNYNFSIHAPPPVTFTVDNKQDVSCFGGATGAITLKGDGGVGGYAYSLDNGANWQTGSNTFTGLAKGSYTALVRDANNCPAAASRTVAIDQPTAALTAGVTGYSDPTGAARTDGSINIAVNGGTAPYACLWSNGATTQNIGGLGDGTYTVSVTDAHGCTAATDPLALVSPLPITISFTETAVSCYGFSDGAIQAAVTGGTKPYTYTWSNGNRTAKATNLAKGRYSLLVTDANNVQFTQDYDLTEPVTLEIVPAVVPVTCNGKTDGAITTIVNGGIAPYTYRWSNGATTPDLSQLAAGSYHLLVTDAHDCPVALGIPVTAPAALNISGAVTPPSRFGNTDAKIDVTVTGGTTPYTYAWSNGATTEDLDAQAAGDYTLHVTDNNNCTAAKTFNVNQPAQLVLTITRDAVIDCYGSSTGALTAHVSGGVAPYTYRWSNGGTTAALVQLPAGVYQLVVTDANGATTAATAMLTDPPVLQLTVTGSEISCDGGSTGTVTSAASGGTPPYSYRWNTGATTPNLGGVAPGMYTLHVTDANNCTLSGSASVTGTGALTVTAFIQPPACNGDDNGFIELQPSGGHTPYTYSWSNGAATKDISNLPAGTYTIRLTDNNNCGISQSYTLTDPAPLQLDLGDDRTLCAGQSVELDGSIPGGSLYSWSGPAGFTANTPVINASATGRYTLVAVDGHSCQATDDVSITQDPREIIANFLVSTEAYTGDTIVAVNITEQAADHAEWVLPPAAKIISQSDKLVELRFDQPGNYKLTLSNQLGNCQTSVSRNIMVLAGTQLPGVNTPHTSLFVRTALRPNPNNGQFYVDILPTADASINYRFLDVQRNRVILEQKGQLTKDVLSTQAFNIPNLPAGVYVLLVESSLETKALKVLIL